MSWITSKPFYKSGETPKFSVGDSVWRPKDEIVYNKKTRLWAQDWEECSVIAVSTSKSGLFFKEFTYSVKILSTDEIVTNVYESELSGVPVETEYSKNYWSEF